jgi:hypothetical protein
MDMRKLAYLFIASVITLTACNPSSSKTGGDTADSGAFHGNSGPADTGMTGSGAPVGTSTGGSDTSTISSNSGATNPVVDTARNRKQE